MKTLNPYILSDEKEQQRIFETLADGGKVDYPLHDTFWGARFGMVTDRYDLHWQLNCEKKQA
jgi:PhnB protein